MTQIRSTPSHVARLGALLFIALPLALGGCSHFLNSSPKPGTEEAQDAANMPSAQVLYAQGLAEMQQENYDRAVTKFNEIDQNYPYSTWSTHAELLAGYAQYKNQDYDSAIGSLSRYIALHPTDDEAAYAYYL